jgi:hypothetical protein
VKKVFHGTEGQLRFLSGLDVEPIEIDAQKKEFKRENESEKIPEEHGVAAGQG